MVPAREATVGEGSRRRNKAGAQGPETAHRALGAESQAPAGTEELKGVVVPGLGVWWVPWPSADWNKAPKHSQHGALKVQLKVSSS